MRQLLARAPLWHTGRRRSRAGAVTVGKLAQWQPRGWSARIDTRETYVRKMCSGCVHGACRGGSCYFWLASLVKICGLSLGSKVRGRPWVERHFSGARTSMGRRYAAQAWTQPELSCRRDTCGLLSRCIEVMSIVC